MRPPCCVCVYVSMCLCIIEEYAISSTQNFYFILTTVRNADHSGRAVEVMSCFRSLERWDCVVVSHSRHGCLWAFFLCLCCSVCR
jgi:hypothetical protein